MNIATFKRLFGVVLLSGLAAGLVLTAVQHLQVTRIIAQAEVFEQAAAARATAPAPAPAHSHADGAAAHQHPQEHEHDANAWEPQDGAERTAFTALSNIVMAVGFGLFLAAAITLSGKTPSWRTGLLWGLAGYAVFFVAPSLGLPPELPGTQAAPLMDRQAWWLFTAALTAGGLAMMVFPKSWAKKVAGLALLATPHVTGAPHPDVHGSTSPEALVESFIVATAIANAVFWLVLGGATGFFHRKLAS